MAWSRSNRKYDITYLGPTKNEDGTPITGRNIVIQGLWYGTDAFFDFTTRKFLKAAVVGTQFLQALTLQENPAFPGDIQRWSYQLDTNDFPDGDFVIFLMAVDGSMVHAQPESFSVYNHSAIGIVPTPIPGTE